MLITFKTITQKTFQLELEDSVKISDLKQQIAKDLGEEDCSLDTMKLIYNGKILEDAETVGSMKFDDKKFVVVMNPKKKPTPPMPAEQPAPTTTTPVVNEPSTSSTTTATQGATTTTTAASDASPTSTTPAVEVPAEAPQSAAAVSTTQDDVPDEHKATLETIVSMGYDRAQAIIALKAAYFNADRAVEYLITGIPISASVVQNVDDEMQGMGENEMSFLNSPQFEELRQIVLENPAALPQIMQEIQSLNPDLLQFIRDNQQVFLDRLNAPAVAGGEDDMEQGEVQAENVPPVGEGQEDQDQQNPSGGLLGGLRTVSVSLTTEEQAAIDRMKAMGFSESIIIEAFIACDRNEELALNYILAHMDDQDAQ